MNAPRTHRYLSSVSRPYVKSSVAWRRRARARFRPAPTARGWSGGPAPPDRAVVPRLIASLASTDEAEAGWAYHLLARVGGPRVIQRARAAVRERRVRTRSRRARSACCPICRRRCRARAAARSRGAARPQRARAARRPRPRPTRSIRRSRSSSTRCPSRRCRRSSPSWCATAARRRRRSSRRCRRAAASPTRRVQALDALYREATATAADRAALEALERGLEYLEAGRPRAARRRLERFVARQPDSAEGRSALGVCLLELDEIDAAHRPSSPRPSGSSRRRRCTAGTWRRRPSRPSAWAAATWRCATTSALARRRRGRRRAPRRGQELRARLRAHAARQSIRACRCATCCAARSCSRAPTPRSPRGATPRRRNGFENVLALVPRHYPSWGNLGAAYLGARSHRRRRSAASSARSSSTPITPSPSTICC